MSNLSRFLYLLFFGLNSVVLLPAQGVGFVLVSDTHYDAENSRPATLSLLEEINDIEQVELPRWRFKAFPRIRGLVHLGDVLNEPNDTAYQHFVEDFGLIGEGKTIYPVYELFGNHDGGYEDQVRQGLLTRNSQRPDVVSVSENGLHYSWSWEDVLFIALNAYPGNEWDDTCGWCHYFKDPFRDPQHSLDFLESELQRLEDPDTPIVLFQHYGWDGFSLLWWTESERKAYYDVIQEFNILGIFHGHNHAVEKRIWNGIPVWSCGSTQRGGEPGDYLVAEIKRNKLRVSHRQDGRWQKIPEVD